MGVKANIINDSPPGAFVDTSLLLESISAPLPNQYFFLLVWLNLFDLRRSEVDQA